SGYKINEADGKGIADWNITINNSTMSRTVKTDQNGSYKFTGLANGSYTVTEETRLDWTNTTPRIINFLISGQNYMNQNFTNKLISLLSQATVTLVGGSGCGRNVNTNEKYSNIKQHEYSREIDVRLSREAIFTFNTLGIVTEVGFTPKTSEGCITALGEILKSRPSQVANDVPHPVIAYFNAWVGPWGYSESSKIEDPYLVFKVSEDNEPVQLMMYKNGAWIYLKTEKIGKDTYKAYSQGFGSFAIVRSPVLISTITPSVTTVPVPGETTAQQPMNLALIIGVFMVLVLVVYYLRTLK
ncbi:MAG: PGF-pre-PGF domain-containing protein, partial [Candidatus Methanoperedens sp.]|nr:PGF-pre-PGF domain-containing protein [Candidatus Methanoperedens sp.]